ncbi:UNVERIFIED_CONTAM: hypothetical protein GTU68_045517 [Idotea baltica]|nr:hypothetical protein [Idotea baltica]
MRLHDKSKCVFCEVCHKAFLTLGALNIHLRIHRGEKPFKCHLCGKCFTQKNHVITHIKRHTKVSSTPFAKKLGPRMFQCEHCPRSFIRLSDYERHVQWNHGAVSDVAAAASIPKSPPATFDSILEGHGEDTASLVSTNKLGMSGETTLNNKVRKKNLRKMMCTIGTQTDLVGGHVIIPRQYQSSTSVATSSTQVSAPPTPRATDEDMYENDIFDEGMDRNFSSDEEDLPDQDQGTSTYQESEAATMSYFHEGASTSANDEAFDAVIGKAKPEPLKSEDAPKDHEAATATAEGGEEEESQDGHQVQSELASEYAKRDEAFFSDPPSQRVREEEKKGREKDQEQEKENEAKGDHSRPPPKPAAAAAAQPPKPPLAPVRKFAPNMHRPTKILENFNTKNWKGRGRGRGRARGRGKSKGVMGLTGATHLRLIRKSMINFISEKTEQVKEDAYPPEETAVPPEEQFANAEPSSIDRRMKRQSKAKPHGPDFVCNVKTCETCNPLKDDQLIVPFSAAPSNPASVVPADKTEFASMEAPSTSAAATPVTPASSTSSVKDQSQKLLQFLISGDEANLQGTDFKLISDVKETQLEARRIKPEDVSSFKTPAEYESSLKKYVPGVDLSILKQDKTEFFTPMSSNSGDFVSPPVELQAFCIPTYSCKLCGREFRFEGKLHRHIESIHQKKAIFSPDVKPGRGSSRDMDRDYTPMIIEHQEPVVQPEPLVAKKSVPRNPEIEALRSEWDDDDDGEEEHEEEEIDALNQQRQYEQQQQQQQQQQHQPFNTQTQVNYAQPLFKKFAPQRRAREIVPVSNTENDIYVSGVKVNINKISGLAGPDMIDFPKKRLESPSTSGKPPAASTYNKQQEKVTALDTKCRMLLEKLFDHALLIECGLFEEHVSVVLGRLLQHYGVKMIEDYGQGQYEVLKYNLWRLIEWKVTMEQMEEFYTEGKSVEEMMDDIMNGRVPIIAHHEPNQEQAAAEEMDTSQPDQSEQMQTVEAVQISENQLMLSQVANVLSGQLNLGDGVTQVVLAQDVSPEMLQGAHIVTIDPNTGQVLSQVTADQVILTESLGEDLNQQIQAMDGHVVVSHAPSPATTYVSTLPPGSIVASTSNPQIPVTAIDTQQIVTAEQSTIKLETSTHSSHSSH